MTSPPTAIDVECPECGERFRAFYRPSVNLSLGEEWSEDELREATTATCPACEHVVELDSLVIGWTIREVTEQQRDWWDAERPQYVDSEPLDADGKRVESSGGERRRTDTSGTTREIADSQGDGD